MYEEQRSSLKESIIVIKGVEEWYRRLEKEEEQRCRLIEVIIVIIRIEEWYRRL